MREIGQTFFSASGHGFGGYRADCAFPLLRPGFFDRARPRSDCMLIAPAIAASNEAVSGGLVLAELHANESTASPHGWKGLAEVV